MSDGEKNEEDVFWAIEINAVLWILVVGSIASANVQTSTKIYVGVGFIVAALLQHWAYYDLYKKNKDIAKAD